MRKFEFTKQPKHIPDKSWGGTTSGQHGAGRFLRAFGLMCLLLLAGWSNRASAQCALVCNDALNVSLPGPSAGCELEVTVDMVLEDPTACQLPMVVTLMTLQGLPLPTSPVVNASHIGMTFIYSVEETNSGNSCWGTLKVEDKLGPEITGCNDIVLTCLANYKPTIDGGNAPTPNVDDCSTVLNFSYTDIIDHGNCTSGYVAFIFRTWVATDSKGNSSTCSQYVTVQRVSLTNFTPVCPANVEMQCGVGNPNTNPTATGYPTITVGGIVYPVIPGANNFCEIAASYNDEVFTICGGGKKILRTWTIYDWCLPTTPGSGNPWSCIQVIKIHDTVPPVIVCPAPIVQGSAQGGCSASLILPPANVTDACSGFTVKVLTPFGIVNGNGGPLLDVPVGVHTITYVATDACGNVSSCTTTLTVNDVTPPVAVCDEHTAVSLTNDGTAIVSATVFDDGSTDNCAIKYFHVSRMPSDCDVDGTPFDVYTTFYCCDIGETIMVAMRVYDYAGNFNTCMVEVEVQDKIDPTIICPPDKTIECSDPVPPVTPPTYSDNCPGVTWAHTETDNISNCGVGYIWRIYTATDASGRTASCTQTITVVNSYPFNEYDITWPYDFTTDECGASIEPVDLPPGYDYPEITEDGCDLVAVAHIDQLLPTNPPACFKILRKWIVIDWCIYNPNLPGSPGYWEHVQVIKVHDNDAPVIVCPGDVTVESLDANCGYGAVAVPPLSATDCSTILNWTTTIDFNSNGTIDQAGTSPNLSGNYPFGTHAVSVKVEDYCGNFSTCYFNITVVDGKKPTPVCVNGLAVELMNDPAGNGGMIQLTPQMFNSGSFDNCTAAQNLILEIIPSFFTCDDVGTNIVTMWATDLAGNADYCETYVIIQDNMVVCPSPLTADVSGGVADASGGGMGNVAINVSGNGPLTAPYTTTQNGNFMFSDLDLGYDYTFTPGYNMEPLNGVTTYDLVLMTRHILNVQPLDTPLKIIAADVNKSGTVTTADVVELRKLVLQIIPNFTNNTSWRFVDKDFVFANPVNPFTPPFPEYFNINNLAADQSGVDFVAVKVGDVNGSAVTNFNGTADNRSFDGELNFVVDEQSLEPGQTYRVAFKASNFVNLTGYQFALRFDPGALSLEDIEAGELAGLSEANFGLTMLEEGIITTSWDNSKNTLHDNNTVLFTLIFKANTKAALSEMLQISSSAIPAEAYQTGGQNVGLLDVNLQFNNPSEVAADFELLQNNPNPFRETTAIGFRLPEAGKATLTVYDLSGNVLKVISGDYAKGFNEIILSEKELGTSGILFYQLETPAHTATRRMVRI
ncbi:MAG: HYR domain-containing protein [Bacteroidetes bacterium]|nr:HYR domain-containing protein [Bacteroidota bacterium]